MELKDLIKAELEGMDQSVSRAVDGLSHNELIWRPGLEAASIGLILYQQMRSEDRDIQVTIQGKTQVWDLDKWYEKLHLPANESGAGYTAAQIAAFPVPELKDLLAYGKAVRAQTLEYVKGVTPEKFEKIIKHPRLGDVTVGALFALIVVHGAHRIGQVMYLRGLQRGLNK